MSVYFITCRKTGTVKIGSSLEPHVRLKELQTAHPFELKVEAILPGGVEEEHDMHRRFADERLRGEWFTITEMIELIIRNNPAGDPPPPRKASVPSKAQLRRIANRRTARQLEEDRREAYLAERRREGQKLLRRLEGAGAIHFPFREKADA